MITFNDVSKDLAPSSPRRRKRKIDERRQIDDSALSGTKSADVLSSITG